MKSNHFLIRLFYLLMSTFLIGRIIFMLYNIAFCDYSAWDVVRAWWNGLTQDIVVTSAALALPALLSLFPIVHLRRWLAPYYFVMSAAVVVLITADTVMYEYWHFKLNAVILSYAAYPEGASSSVSPYYLISRIGCAVAGTLALTALSLRLTPGHTANRERVKGPSGRHAIDWQTPAIVVFAFILMASTVNAGTAYWNQRLFLNHSAANPVFAFFSSFHTRPYHDRYISMNEEGCRNTFNGLYDVKGANTDTLLCNTRPNVMVVLLESFGSPFVKSLGGAPVDARLEELIPEGIYWENYYSSSFRTDRAVVSTFSGWISYPDLGLMTHPEIHDSLPSLARSLKNAGYCAKYLYHGPMTNMGSGDFARDMGFKTYTQHEFPDVPLDCSWGAHDRVSAIEAATLMASPSETPKFIVWQTISSHEPWDVPEKRFDDPVQNAFAYTDAALGDLVDSLKRSDVWNDLLLIVIPDHGYLYGQSYEDEGYFHAPMLWLGGAVKAPRRMDVLINQSDIAATLLAQMEIPHAEFKWSRNVLSEGYTHPFVYSTFPAGFLYRDATGTTIYDTGAELPITQHDAGKAIHYGPHAITSKDGHRRLQRGRAILQTSYDKLWKTLHR